jgi:HAD superfamily phosphoserine phosphatase-like hydrolase
MICRQGESLSPDIGRRFPDYGPMTALPLKHFLLASDFDQTLSFKDSGVVLAELLGIDGFEDRVAGLARSNLVQQGGELAYLIRHDPEFRGVRREHLVEAGRRVRLKSAIPALIDFMEHGTAGYQFSFFVISAAPREIVISALAGVIPPEHIYGTELEFDARSGEVTAIKRVPAGYGKVAVIEELQHRLEVTPDRVIYIGDGSSDVHVMLHVNNHDGFTIAVSENKQLARIAKRTILSDNAFSIMVPILDQLLHWETRDIRALFESYGLTLNEWEKERTDRVRISEVLSHADRVHAGAA